MNIRTTSAGLFYRALAGATLAVPMLLVIAAAVQPNGERGTVIVNGLGALLAIVAAALVLRAAYRWALKGDSRQAIASSQRRGTVDYDKHACTSCRRSFCQSLRLGRLRLELLKEVL